jgi:tetratricopeptide (TPR) repeat protein
LELINQAEALEVNDKDAGPVVRQMCVVAKVVGAFASGDYDKALPLLEQARGVSPSVPDYSEFLRPILDVMLGTIYDEQGRYVESERVYRAAIESFEHSADGIPLYYGFALLGLSDTLIDQSRFGEALTVIKKIDIKAFGDDGAEIEILVRHWTARSRWGLRDKAAVALYKDAIEALRKSLPAMPARLKEAYMEQGDMFIVLGKLEDADESYKSALRVVEENWPKETVRQGRIYTHMGSIYLDHNLYQQADDALHRALGLLRTPLHDDTEEVAFVLLYLGRLAARQGDFPKSVGLFRETMSIERRVVSADSLFGAQTEEELGQALWDSFQIGESIIYLRHSESIQNEHFKDEPDRVASVRQSLAWALLEAGDYGGARETGEKAYLSLVGKADKNVGQLSGLANLISRASMKLTDLVKAEKYLKLAEELDRSRPAKTSMQTWLTEALFAECKGQPKKGLGFIDQIASVCKDSAETLSYRCPEALRVKGELLAAEKDISGARQALEEAVQGFLEKKYPLAPDLAEAYINLADIFHQQGELEQEKHELGEAQTILVKIFGVDNQLALKVTNRLVSLAGKH